MTSFADLKAKRQSKNGVVAASALADSSATAKTMTADEDMPGLQAEAATSGNDKQAYSISLYGLDDGLLEIRDTPDAGRGLFAKKKITPGTVLMSRKPYLALLDKAHLPVICSNCMRDRGRELLRCAGCAAVWYCSKQCQKEQWQPLKHKLECRRLRHWADDAKKAGITDDIPDTPVRAIGNMLLLKEHMPKEWWEAIQAMAGSPRALTPLEQEQNGTLAVAVTHYIGFSSQNATSSAMNDSTSGLVSIFPEYADDTAKMTRALLETIDKFSINSFSLTDFDLTNLGVAVNPAVALINHSCRPNCSVVFPNGPTGDMKVVAFSTVEPGEELLSSYLDLTMPVDQRLQELMDQYKFECNCPECQEGKQGNEKRRSVECIKSGCSGYVPLPGRAEMVGTKELPCIKCKSVRNVQLGDEKDPKGGSIKHGIAYLMDTAADVLPRVSKQPVEGPMAANMASLGVSADSDPKIMVDKCIRLCKEHHLSPCSYPHLSLNRHVLESVLMHATAGAGSTTDFRFARQLSRLVLRGLEAIYPMGHPVRAIQHVMLARLLGLGENQGEQITDIPNLRIAYEQMKIAYGEVRIAYGKDEVKGSVLTGKTMAPLVDIRKDTEAQLKALERDIAWRETAYRDMKERR